MTRAWRGALVVGLLALGGVLAWGAAASAVIKVARGTAWVQRAGQTHAARVGFIVLEGDVLLTGSDGAVGVTFSDNSLISLGPSSKLGVLRYTYNPATGAGRFDCALYWGTMSATSGRVATERGSMSVATPRAVYRIHGTDTVIRVEGGP